MRARIASGLPAMGASLPSVVPRSGSWGSGRRQCAMAPSVVLEVLDGWMRPFRGHFTAAVWRHALVLVGGALLAPGRRTVAAALRVMGFAEAAGFAAYPRVLSHGHWCSRALAQRLLLLLVAALVPHGPVVGGRARRHHRTPTGQAHQRQRHLPRPGPLQPRSLRQSQWPALALRHAAGTCPLRWLRLGPAFPDRVGALRAVRRRAGPAAQEAHGLGPAGAAAGRPLAARATCRRGGRQRLLGHRPAARPRAAPDRGHPPAPLDGGCLALLAPAASDLPT